MLISVVGCSGILKRIQLKNKALFPTVWCKSLEQIKQWQARNFFSIMERSTFLRYLLTEIHMNFSDKRNWLFPRFHQVHWSEAPSHVDNCSRTKCDFPVRHILRLPLQHVVPHFWEVSCDGLNFLPLLLVYKVAKLQIRSPASWSFLTTGPSLWVASSGMVPMTYTSFFGVGGAGCGFFIWIL